MMSEDFRHGMHQSGGAQHAGFHCGDREGIQQEQNLIDNDGRWQRMHGPYDVGGFGNHASDGGESVNMEMLEGFEIRLNSRPTAAVRAGDGEGNGDGSVHALICPALARERASTLWISAKPWELTGFRPALASMEESASL